jgi:hypothetical protein
LQAIKQVAAFALIVDAKNVAAKDFYQHYGFTPCVDSPMTFYLPLGQWIDFPAGTSLCVQG